MPLTPDPSKAIEIDRFVAVRFAMFDGEKRVVCRVRWKGLQDRAALDQTDQRDVRGTFEKYRAEIEKGRERPLRSRRTESIGRVGRVLMTI